jgi:hypothetical protein
MKTILILLCLFCVSALGQTFNVVTANIGSINGAGAAPAGCTTLAHDAMAESGTGPAAQVGQYCKDWGIQFTAGSSFTVCAVDLVLRALGSPTFTVRADLWSDNGADLPLALLGSSSTLDASTLGATFTTNNFTGLSVALTSGTKYWVVCHASASDPSHSVEWSDGNTYNFKEAYKCPDDWVVQGGGLYAYRFNLYSAP